MAFGVDPYANVPTGWRQRQQISDPFYDSGHTATSTRMGPMGTGVGPYSNVGSTGGLPQSTATIESYIRTNYPYMAAFLNNPEVGPILYQAGKEHWDTGRLYGALQQTKWWQTTSASARMWDDLVAEDPAEAARQAAQTAATIQNRARSLGINMDNATIQKLATDATRMGWTDAQVVDELMHSVNWATLQGGDLTANRDTVKSIARNYLVNVSDATAQNYAAAIASGEMTEAGVASIMQAQAASRFGWMSDQIKQGVSPSQYLMPVRDTIANELEMAPENVDLMNPKWLQLVETRDPKTGDMRSATLNEAMLAARRQPEYWNTNKAQQSMAALGNRIADVFGRRGL